MRNARSPALHLLPNNHVVELAESFSGSGYPMRVQWLHSALSIRCEATDGTLDRNVCVRKQQSFQRTGDLGERLL